MRENSIVLWIALAAALLAVLNLPDAVTGRAKAVIREGLAPLHSLFAGTAGKVRESVRSIRGIGGLIGENRKMAEEMTLLRSRVRDLQVYEQENAQLRELLQFANLAERRLIPCEIIARDITGWWQTIRLGKGSVHGIAPDMAVVSAEGLVGKTVSVSPRTCDVLLISDPGCKVSSRIARTGAFGLVAGGGPTASGQYVCRMEFINRNLPVMPGDEVVTAGLGGVFPKGLLVGYTDQVRTNETGLYLNASVIPKADLGTLGYVFVVADHANPVDAYLRARESDEGEAP